mmetsp:Transcript_98012/g.211288  ORF Transcript_98012/g.211288 Transcript_98012/m.211288 type:complete len:210 (-) Transcript_98012:2095-2724(-)
MPTSSAFLLWWLMGRGRCGMPMCCFVPLSSLPSWSFAPAESCTTGSWFIQWKWCCKSSRMVFSAALSWRTGGSRWPAISALTQAHVKAPCMTPSMGSSAHHWCALHAEKQCTRQLGSGTWPGSAAPAAAWPASSGGRSRYLGRGTKSGLAACDAVPGKDAGSMATRGKEGGAPATPGTSAWQQSSTTVTLQAFGSTASAREISRSGTRR